MKTILSLLPCFLLWSCASPEPPSSGDMRRAKPVPTAKPDTAPVGASIGSARTQVREVVKVVQVANKNNATQKRQIEALTITVADLNRMLEEKDIAVQELFDRLQLEIIQLEHTRVAQEERLKAASLSAIKAEDNLVIAEIEKVKLQKDLDAGHAELVKYRETYDSVVLAKVKEEKLRAKAEAKAAKLQSYWDSRYERKIKTIAWSAGITFLIIVALLLWQYFTPSGMAGSVASGVFNNLRR